MFLKKIGLIALAIAFSTSFAFADGGYRKKPRTNKPNYHGGYVEKNHRPRGNRNYYRRGNNYYYYNNKNYYNNKKFYNDPYFWGGVAGGLIGGAIIRDYYEPECQTIWVEVYVPGEGYRQRQQVVCN